MRRIQFIVGLVLCGAILSSIVRSHGNQDDRFRPLKFVRDSNSIQTRNDAAILDGWIDKVENGWEVGKNHDRVKSVFESVVSGARKSTVKVLHKNDTIALGTIVDVDGLILTKASEIEGRDPLFCQLHNGWRKKTRIVGIIDRHDLAMLKIDASGLQAIRFKASQLEIGSIVATPNLGSKPVAIGVVSIVEKKVKSDAILGITLDEKNGKPFIKEVLPSSPADKAGLKNKDYIVSINDKFVSSENQVVRLIGRNLPGEIIRMLVERNGKKFEFSPRLGRFSDLDKDNGDFQGYLGGKLSRRRSGFPNVIQHDTFLLPDHCGGPMVDLQGNVIGMNIARAERIASFALPPSILEDAIKKLKSNVQPKSEGAE